MRSFMIIITLSLCHLRNLEICIIKRKTILTNHNWPRTLYLEKRTAKYLSVLIRYREMSLMLLSRQERLRKIGTRGIILKVQKLSTLTLLETLKGVRKWLMRIWSRSRGKIIRKRWIRMTSSQLR